MLVNSCCLFTSQLVVSSVITNVLIIYYTVAFRFMSLQNVGDTIDPSRVSYRMWGKNYTVIKILLVQKKKIAYFQIDFCPSNSPQI